MFQKYIIAALLILAGITALYFILPGRACAQGIEPLPQLPPKPFTPAEWKDQRSEYLTGYNSNSTDKRLRADVEQLLPCGGRMP